MRWFSNLLGRGRRNRLATILALPAFAVLMIATHQSAVAGDMVKSGTVTIQQTQIAFIGSGNLGGGELTFKGKTYKFTVGGLGYGGFGISTMTATGTVYNLTDPSQFSGAYIQGRYGIAVGTASTGELWLSNDAGVVMQLKADRTGLALSLGADAVYIGFN